MMFLILLVVLPAALAAELPVKVSQDYFTPTYDGKPIPVVEAPSVDYTSPSFRMRHWSSNRWIRPHGGAECPHREARTFLNDGHNSANTLSFTWRQNEGHYGHIVHNCGRVLHRYRTETLWLDQPDNFDRNSRFTYDERRQYMTHTDNSLHISPWNYQDDPGNNSLMQLQRNIGNPTRIELLERYNNNIMPLFPTPTMSGRWISIFSVQNPIGEWTQIIEHRMGWHATETVSIGFGWKFSPPTALGWFLSSPEFSVQAQLTRSETWSAEVTTTRQIRIFPGQSVFCWQYVLTASQWGDEVDFRTTNYHDTETSTPPDIWT